MTAQLAAAALAGDKRAVGRLVSRFEADPRDEADVEARVELLAALDRGPRARLIGVTGPPGAGKSTLVGALALELVAAGRSCAVLAVDPSSPRSGGALLGDRVRAAFPPGEARLFFRSQSTGGSLGGLAPRTLAAVRVLERLYDLVLIETVGVGQSELDVCTLADRTLLVTTPASGDRVQGLKAGLMELVDAVALNKVDLPGAERARRELASALGTSGRGQVPLLAVSARSGEGLATVRDWVTNVAASNAVEWTQRRLLSLRQTLFRRFGEPGARRFEVKVGSFAPEEANPGWDDRLESEVILHSSIKTLF